MTWRLTSIVSGARPGAQRGALAAAVDLGLGYGGWVPAGTVVDAIYRDRVRASSSGSSIMAMRLNVQDSDGTLIVSFARTLAGSAAVIDGIADGQRKAALHVVLPAGGESGMPDAIMTEILEWLAEARIGVLNVAGPLEDEEPGIEQATRDLLVWVLEDAVAEPSPSVESSIEELAAEIARVGVSPRDLTELRGFPGVGSALEPAPADEVVQEIRDIAEQHLADRRP